MSCSFDGKSSRRGLGRIESLMTLVTSGLFVATMLPETIGPVGDPQAEVLQQNLDVLRTQIELYRYEHEGRWPAKGTTDPAAFESALLEPETDRDRGPYIVGVLPANPYNGSRTVRVVDSKQMPTPDDSTGWLYNSETGRIEPNTRVIVRVADGR